MSPGVPGSGPWSQVSDLRCLTLAQREEIALGRARGEPLPHPKIPEGDQDAAVAHWEDKRRQSLSVRDWYSLYQADPQPSEGALVTAAVTALSAFMNNVGAVAIIMPVAIMTAEKANRSPGTLLMPVAFGSLLGGLITLLRHPVRLRHVPGRDDDPIVARG